MFPTIHHFQWDVSFWHISNIPSWYFLGVLVAGCILDGFVSQWYQHKKCIAARSWLSPWRRRFGTMRDPLGFLHGRVSSWLKKMYIWLTWQQSWAEDSENLPKLRVRYMHTDDSNSNRFNSKTSFIYSSWTAICHHRPSLTDWFCEWALRALLFVQHGQQLFYSLCWDNKLLHGHRTMGWGPVLSCCLQDGKFYIFHWIVVIDLVLNIMFRCYTHYFLRFFSWSSNQSIYTFGNPKTSPCRCPTFQGGVKSDVLAALGSVVASAT